MPIEIAVVVATRDRAHLLQRLLEALRGQTLEPDRYEILVVDDGSCDETPAVLAAQASSESPRIRTIRSPQSRGPAHARELGWRTTEAAVIAFTDDDCVPAPDWLATGLQGLDETTGVLMGRTEADPDAPGYGEPFARTMEVDHEDGRYPTCNVFYRRVALEEAGGFDQTFRFACGEDSDLAWRVKKSGWQSAFLGTAIVRHDVRPPDFRLFLQERRRFADQVLLVKKHPELRALFYRRWFYRRSHPRILLGALALVGGGWFAPAFLLAPLCWLERLRGVSLGRGVRSRVRNACAILVADHWEVAVFVGASLRYRTVLV